MRTERSRTPQRGRRQLSPLRRLTALVPVDLWTGLDEMAAADGRSLSSYVMRLLERHITEERERQIPK